MIIENPDVDNIITDKVRKALSIPIEVPDKIEMVNLDKDVSDFPPSIRVHYGGIPTKLSYKISGSLKGFERGLHAAKYVGTMPTDSIFDFSLSVECWYGRIAGDPSIAERKQVIRYFKKWLD